jgi:hypothetical protein
MASVVGEADADLYAEDDIDSVSTNQTTPYPGGIPPLDIARAGGVPGALPFIAMPPLVTGTCSLVEGLCMDPRCQICIRVIAQRARMDLEEGEIERFLACIKERR